MKIVRHPMTNTSTDNSPNPYAALESREQVPESPPPTTQGYQIFGQTLYCEGSLNFSDVCWLTGSTDVLSRKILVNKPVKHRWSRWLSPLLVVLCILFLAGSFGLPKNYRGLAPLALPILLGLKIAYSQWGTKFKILVGQSQKALESEKAAKKILWILAPLEVCFVIALSQMMNFKTISTAIASAFVLGSMAIYTFSPLKAYHVQVRRDEDGAIAVSGLHPEFLIALKNRLVEGLDSD